MGEKECARRIFRGIAAMTGDYLHGLKPGTVIFAGPDDAQSIEEARVFVAEKGIEKESVKLMRFEVELENELKAKIIALVVK